MKEMIAYCGLNCFKCPIYLATREKNVDKKKKMRIDVIRECKKQYGIELKLEEITDCDGCLLEGGRLFSGSRKCKIRNCARIKRVENCAHCDEYACEKLEEFFITDPEAKKQLDQIRRSL